MTEMKEAVRMDVSRVVSRGEWLVARRERLTVERDAAAERMGDRGFCGTDLSYRTMMCFDLAPLGRQDDGVLRHHDRYGG
jgi:predicted dithiol-disulfide oxidoreductase (DUF899 family)